MVLDLEQLRHYCISKKGTTEELPFNNDTLVFKVMGKMFIMVPLDRWENGRQISIVKTDPNWAVELRESYQGFIGGFQMGKQPDARYVNTRHWNTIVHHSDVSDEFAKELIDHSYHLVIKNLTKKVRDQLNQL